MHIIAFVESVEHVCCRYRIAAFNDIWKRAGHRLEFVAIPRGFFARARMMRKLREADVVIVQRKFFNVLESQMLRQACRKIVFDFDDALWLRDSYSAKGFESASRLRGFRRMMKLADVVVAGNTILAEQAKQFHHRDSVHIIPTCINLEQYPLPPRKSDKPLSLVWIGSSSTLQGIEQRRDLWERIGQEVPGIRLKIICDRFPQFQHLPVDVVPWNEATEAAELASADIGIGWVPDDPWSRGKCGLKLLQYHTAGLPVIANPVGVQAEIVRHGETGLLATTDEEWIAAVKQLAADAEERAQFGSAGREQVEMRYSLEAGGRLWAELLARLAVSTGFRA